MHYTIFFSAVKIENVFGKKFDVSNIFVQNIDCGYRLEPPCGGGSNKYLQFIFWIKNKKKCILYPYVTQIYRINVGYKRAGITCTCFPDESLASMNLKSSSKVTV